MATTIVTKNGSGAPAASDLVAGELAVDLTNGRLYTEDSGGSVIEIGLNPSGNVDVTGTVTADKLITDSGVDAASFTSTGSTYVDINNGTVTGRLQTISSDFFIGTATVGTSLAFKSGNGVEAMRIDSSGNTTFKANNSAVGPIVTLENTATAVNGQAWGSIHFDSNDSSTGASGTRASIIGTSTSFNGDGNLTFSTAPANGSNTERMRLDSSGNLLVGTTDSTPYNNTTGGGFVVASSGLTSIARETTASNQAVLHLNNTGVDGILAEFAKDGTAVGSIGTSAGHFYVGAGGDTNLLFNDTANSIYPWDSSANDVQDATVDLGANTARFKDLHLSGLGYISGSDTQTNNIASASLGLRLSNTSNTDNNFAPIDFFNSSGFVTARIGAQFVDAGDRNTDLFFATRANSGSLTERMRIDSSGNLLIGVSTFANNTLGVAIRGAASGATDESIRCAVPATSSVLQIGFYNANGRVGSISTSGSATAFNTSSDYRLKENVVAMSGATERLKQLKPSRFNFIADANTTVDGFLAHEVQDVVPEAISGTKDAMRDEEYEVTPAVLDDDGNVVTEAVIGTRSVPDYQGIDQSKLVPLLVATIQELEARIAALES